jgi:hypothetical protein
VPPSAARPRWAARRPLAVLLAGAALSGCSTDRELDVDGFQPGPCTEVIATLQDVDDVLRGLEDEEITPRAAATRFQQAQDALAPVTASAAASVSVSLEELAARLGFFRLSVDTGSYGDGQDAAVRRALDDVAQDCRGA